MQQVVYFYEGECEKKLLEHLKYNNNIESGKTQKFNLWQDKFKTLVRMLLGSNKLEIYFVIDTDNLKILKTFRSNINNLKKYNICLIVQNKNFEDELCYICNENEINLFTRFDTNNKAEFTSKFIKTSNLQNKLSNCDFAKLWTRDKEFIQFLKKHNLKVKLYKNYE